MSANLDAKLEQIISSQRQISFSSLGLGMLFTRLSSRYKASPTADVMKACLAEANAFIDKYRSILTDDLAKL